MNVGILTGGGDCPGLNAVIRAVYKAGIINGYKMFGVRNGFKGLVQDDIKELTDAAVSGILHRGGTILGTTNRDNPFHYRTANDTYVDASPVVMRHIEERGLDVLVVIGGDGTLKLASEIGALGVGIIGIPKTIDNDLGGTDRTFGFDSAVAAATDALDRLHTTAESHHRIHILEVMGRTAGWIALHSGISGGADIILIPELNYSLDNIVAKINQRVEQGKLFSIIVVAEGVKADNNSHIIKRKVEGSPEQYRFGGIGDFLAEQLEKASGIECRTTVLGHLQRGGSPTAFDRILSSRYGEYAIELLNQGKTNKMVALHGDSIVGIDLDKAIGNPRQVPLDSPLIATARNLGICLG
jgi:6-phosphofructokinase 1